MLQIKYSFWLIVFSKRFYSPGWQLQPHMCCKCCTILPCLPPIDHGTPGRSTYSPSDTSESSFPEVVAWGFASAWEADESSDGAGGGWHGAWVGKAREVVSLIYRLHWGLWQHPIHGADVSISPSILPLLETGFRPDIPTRQSGLLRLFTEARSTSWNPFLFPPGISCQET